MTARTHLFRLPWVWAALVLTLLKLWLTRGQAVFAIGFAAHDDRLFLQLAEHLTQGEWLGPYNQLTLAKGPFYSLWAALIHQLHLPLYFSQQLLYAAACAAVVRACAPGLPSAAARFAFYTLLWWNPMSYDASSLGRVLRQNIYSSEVLLIFAGLAALYYRRQLPLRRLVPWALLLGLAGGAFYLTREEAIWLAPSAALLAGAGGLMAWRAGRDTLVRLLMAAGLSGLAALLLPLLVSTMNHHYYRWFGTVEFRAPAFKAAYGAMTRVKAGPDIPFVPVTREARQLLYAASPTFAKLRPHLDGPIGRGWAAASAELTGLPAERGEIAGGWLIWALRDAVAATGEARDAGEAMSFYRAMAAEINAACDADRLPAGPPRNGFLPILREGQAAAIGRTFLEFADFTISFRRFSAFAPPSEGDAASLVLFRDMTRERLSPSAETAKLQIPHPSALDYHRTQVLQVIGKIGRRILFGLFFLAQILAVGRVAQLVRQRRWTFALTLAAAAWGGAAAYLLITAVLQVTSYPILAVSSFAPIYPLLLVFISAALWDAAAAWWPVKSRQADKLAAPSPAASPAPRSATTPEPEPPAPIHPRMTAALPWIGGLSALAPFLIWQRQFAELFWFGDDYFLIDQMSAVGFWPWVGLVFAENFVPLFKLLWGGAVLRFDGSYLAMLWLLWLTHAANTICLGRLLLRSGVSWLGTAVTLALFALPAANLETLGWSVQWSAVLATFFLLLALLWHERHARPADRWSLPVHGPLILLAGASACCFSRGVLTGAVLALAILLPALLRREPAGWPGRLVPAALCLLPAGAVAGVILAFSGGNHQHMAGHVMEAVEYAFGFFLLNPGFLLLDVDSWSPGSLLFLVALKLLLVAGGLKLASIRTRPLLLLLLAYDLGNAGLLGIGRYHTGFHTVISSRYYYSSLLATLPFASVLLTGLLARWRVRSATWLPPLAAAGLLAGLTWHCLQTWTSALPPFVESRGTELRRVMRAPAVAGSKETVPALDFMHVERAKALIRAYHLH
jgi:hypothetical protein